MINPQGLMWTIRRPLRGGDVRFVVNRQSRNVHPRGHTATASRAVGGEMRRVMITYSSLIVHSRDWFSTLKAS